MRWILVGWGVLGVAALVWAANGTGDAKKAEPPLDHQQALTYAQELGAVVSRVALQYVRPVDEVELLAAALGGLFEAARQPEPPTLKADLERAAAADQLFDAVVRIRQGLGDPQPLRGPNALLVSFHAMCRVLDPHTAVITGEELRRSSELDENRRWAGLELENTAGVGPLVVRNVVPGGPAQQAGVRPGDRITHVDGRPVDETTGAALLPRLNGANAEHDPGAVGLTLWRAGAPAPWKVSLSRSPFTAESVWGVRRHTDHHWDYWLDRERKLAHVRVGPLIGTDPSQGTNAELEQVLNALKQDGLRGLILDLRWSPGGYLNQAVKVASLFLQRGTVATVRYRTQKTQEHQAIGNGAFSDFPIVILINGETSGGAELIASSLQDNGRAAVAGTRSRGKGSVQTAILDFPVPNAGLKVTSGQFIRPNGKNLHRFPDSKPGDDWGVRPDPKRALPISPDLEQQLKEWWQWQTLRPGTGNAALPLDDPELDPQRQAAGRMLEELIRAREEKLPGPLAN